MKRTEQRKMSEAERLDQINRGSENTRGCRDFSEMLVMFKNVFTFHKVGRFSYFCKEQWHKYGPSFFRPRQHQEWVYDL